MEKLVVKISKIISSCQNLETENNQLKKSGRNIIKSNLSCSLSDINNALDKYIENAKGSIDKINNKLDAFIEKVDECCSKYQDNESEIDNIDTDKLLDMIVDNADVTYEYNGNASKNLIGIKEMDFSQVPIIKAQAIVDKYKDRDVDSLTNEEFLEYIGAAAQIDYKKSGILPSVTMAQAICESGWGNSAIGNNLFGIKCGSGWNGKRVNCRTKEQSSGGKYYSINADFRDYDSVLGGIEDHSDLLNNTRYQPVRKACDNKDSYEACRQLKACGYATSHTYANTLISIINDNDLTKYDNI